MSEVILLHALLLASMALALCITSSEFQLHNLAAGILVVLGGWISTEFTGLFNDDRHNTNAVWLIPILAVTVALVTYPRVAKTTIRSHSLLFLLISLGVAFAVSGIAQSFYLPSARATIPTPTSAITRLLLALTAFSLSIGVSLAIFLSKRWHYHILEWRIAGADSKVWKYVSHLVLLQCVLLLVIGMCFAKAHRGLFGAAEYKTILAVLAVFAVRFRPVYAAALAGLLGAAVQVVDAYVPWLSGWSVPVVATIVGIIVVVRYIGATPVLNARPRLGQEQQVTLCAARLEAHALH